jgi:hypothetical protein
LTWESASLDRRPFFNWKRFEKLLNETTYLSATGNGGAIRATTSQMTDEEAGRCLREAFEIFSKITEAYGAAAQRERTEGRQVEKFSR